MILINTPARWKLLGFAVLALCLLQCREASGSRDEPDPSHQQLLVPPRHREGFYPDTVPAPDQKDPEQGAPDHPIPADEDTLLPRMA